MELHEYESIDDDDSGHAAGHFGRWSVPGGWLYERVTPAGVALAFVPDPKPGGYRNTGSSA